MPRKQTKARTNINGRAPGQTQISISLPEDMVKRIDRLAGLENRNRSNFIVNELRRISETKLAGKKK